MVFLLLVAAGFAGMEVASYLIHRYLFHGMLWRVHATHHRPHPGPFEPNDLFSLAFAAVSIGLMWAGRTDPTGGWTFPIGTGIALYGILYFVLHDLYTHRRFLPFSTRNNALHTIRRAHQRHHQRVDRRGQEPYGLFLFPYAVYRTPFRRRRDVVAHDEGTDAPVA